MSSQIEREIYGCPIVYQNMASLISVITLTADKPTYWDVMYSSQLDIRLLGNSIDYTNRELLYYTALHRSNSYLVLETNFNVHIICQSHLYKSYCIGKICTANILPKDILIYFDHIFQSEYFVLAMLALVLVAQGCLIAHTSNIVFFCYQMVTR